MCHTHHGTPAWNSALADGGAWLAYACSERVIGLVAWPLDGDPRSCIGVIAHPGDIQALALTCNGQHLISLGVSRAGSMCLALVAHIST